MKQDLVTYKNDINQVSFRNFNARELDLFFSLVSIAKNKQTNEILLPFEELKELAHYTETSLNVFVKDLESVYNKLIGLTFGYRNEHEIVRFTLFNQYNIKLDRREVSIKVNEDFKYLLNDITSNFTSYELEEFTTLKSTYARTAYRLLKQYKQTGYYVIDMQEFKRLFDVPRSYQQTNITTRILNPIGKELSKYFNNLKINKIKSARDNKTISHIEFQFRPQIKTNKYGEITYRNDQGDYYSMSIFDMKGTDHEYKRTFKSIEPLSDRTKHNKK